MFYLATNPQTVVSVVRFGKIPEKLPDWAQIDYLSCAKESADCLSGNKAPLNQIFILELDIPRQISMQNNFLFLESIQPNYVKEIYVYSEVGYKLLNRLFNGQCPVNIKILPNVFSDNAESKKRPRVEEVEEETQLSKKQNSGQSKNLNVNQATISFSPKSSSSFSTFSQTKKTIATENKSNSLQILQKNPLQATSKKTINSSPQLRLANTKPQISIMPPKIIDRIATYAEHIELLTEAFTKARYNILVTSYSISHETLLKANLYQLIPEAVNRGVKIYIYYNDVKNLDNRVKVFLKKYNIIPQETYTHSKILSADKNLIVTGSFNWLSTLNSKYQESDEGSFVIRGDICAQLKEDFWEFIKYYRNMQFGNDAALDRFEENSENDNTIIYDLNSTTELAYIPTLEEHCGYFTECFEIAKQRLIICSPFISSTGAYESDINFKLLQETTNRGVNIFFVCSAEADGLNSFKNFLLKINLPKIHLITVSNIHLKTIIVDEDIITEGSFNWLSATRNALSDYHNHEQTLHVKGSLAKNLIEKFFNSRVGKLIQQAMPKLSPVAHQLPFFKEPHSYTQKSMANQSTKKFEDETNINNDDSTSTCTMS